MMNYADAYCWLAAICLVTAVMSVPYVLNRIMRQGLTSALGYFPEGDRPEWANRCQKAHYNAVENLVVFAPLVLVAIGVGLDAGMVANVAMIYFWARVVHYLVYCAGIPVVRTLAFLVGFGAQFFLAWQILSKLGHV